MSRHRTIPTPTRSDSSATPLRIGVSACLLGLVPKSDGKTIVDRYLRTKVSSIADFVPICPERDLGLAAPREPLRLERRGVQLRLVAKRAGLDLTEAMAEVINSGLSAPEMNDLDGFVLMRGSATCGLERVAIHDAEQPGSVPNRKGQGIFASALRRRFPLLPLEEAGRLNDPVLRESFFSRVYAYRRLKALFRPGWQPEQLQIFHRREELLLTAHDGSAAARMGPLVGLAHRLPPQLVQNRYSRLFMAALAQVPTPQRHRAVLERIASRLAPRLDVPDRDELAGAIHDYGRGMTPINVPLVLLRHHLRRHAPAQLNEQTYLEPAPAHLALRNHSAVVNR
jgi:uncharacterized protein YbgA (DUF1722 family)/uncharacterized protein YbbK (DUF523 family)